MAITVRGLEAHQKMTKRLKYLTKKSTLSGALIEGGYAAIRYHDLYIEEQSRAESLETELKRLKGTVDTLISSLQILQEYNHGES
ncbi:hypothetical protein [Veronia pacifica]|uniref:Uncharacterized protein n=1 Tax=Veronia pacifica TaxID=1080227 RepID=A0A1C3EAP0_9GAMM|nr:hypothetical protein [Veronia pacifica]ODA30264.1 hypothetical protein A8L45_20550 [Veronia pacifica]